MIAISHRVYYVYIYGGIYNVNKKQTIKNKKQPIKNKKQPIKNKACLKTTDR